ncbi:hypothetical protein B0H67DRAFT_372039 [Lasiosphaeris hirsuta]|uniref:Uncharacterized protein n=1 Tax=Lasiosphaeris hirsuta TaxID=260670 RepID=A0AA39ZWU7_9PEZI|nr:hypothetical protein B0H67DRAFT_372039 [Lasiosphaeris hirsuta]
MHVSRLLQGFFCHFLPAQARPVHASTSGSYSDSSDSYSDFYPDFLGLLQLPMGTRLPKRRPSAGPSVCMCVCVCVFSCQGKKFAPTSFLVSAQPTKKNTTIFSTSQPSSWHHHFLPASPGYYLNTTNLN